jgi:hypothetical protein
MRRQRRLSPRKSAAKVKRRLTSQPIRSKEQRCAPRARPVRWPPSPLPTLELSAPDAYREKIAIGPDYPDGVVDLDAPPEENIAALVGTKGVEASAITALILDRPRHSSLVATVRRVGATVCFIVDGDAAGVICTGEPAATSVDAHMGNRRRPAGSARRRIALHRRIDARTTCALKRESACLKWASPPFRANPARSPRIATGTEINQDIAARTVLLRRRRPLRASNTNCVSR